MHNESIVEDHHEINHDVTDVFGFWLYIMTDCILFGCLFAAFVVLDSQSMSANALRNFIDLHTVLIETFLLLASNFTFGLAILSLYRMNRLHVQLWLIVTFLFGAAFVALELQEFIHLASEGFRWDYTGQASAFFTLVGTHGLHVSFGLLWILVMIFQLRLIAFDAVQRRMMYLGLFWNFLDIVWIFVFTIVYLTGKIA